MLLDMQTDYNHFILDFQNAVENGHINEATDILRVSFRERIRGKQKDNADFVDFLINLPSDVLNSLILQAPLNFFYQQNAQKQTFLHLLAAKDDYISVFQNLMRNETPDEAQKVEATKKVLLGQKNGEGKTTLDIAIELSNTEFISK